MTTVGRSIKKGILVTLSKMRIKYTTTPPFQSVDRPDQQKPKREKREKKSY
jgi:hypothetical protein